MFITGIYEELNKMKRGHLETYPVKILLAFTEALSGNVKFFHFLEK